MRWGPLIHGDLATGELLERVLRTHAIEGIIQLRWLCLRGRIDGRARQVLTNNVANSIKLLEAAKGAGVGAVVFSSTCATYGVPERVPIGEDAPQRPINPYGESKLFVVRALHWYQQAHSLAWVALRYFNAAGADPDGEIGEDHDPETHLVPLVIQAALGERADVEIYGDDYPTPDGNGSP